MKWRSNVMGCNSYNLMSFQFHSIKILTRDGSIIFWLLALPKLADKAKSIGKTMAGVPHYLLLHQWQYPSNGVLKEKPHDLNKLKFWNNCTSPTSPHNTRKDQQFLTTTATLPSTSTVYIIYLQLGLNSPNSIHKYKFTKEVQCSCNWWPQG